MTKPISVFSLVAFAALVTGCASASKDIHFRSRLPTQEIPLLSFEKEQQFGFDVDLENNRFTFQPTHNLVDNYDLNQNNHYFSRDQESIAGGDISGTYRRMVGTAPMKVAVSFDFLEFQVNPFSQPDHEWFTNLNFGVYKTAAFTSEGTDCVFCFNSSQSERDAEELKEKNITTKQAGFERKMGLQIGHIWQEKYAIAASYTWMNYEYTADVSKVGAGDLNLKENFFASGAGLGFFFIPRQAFNFGITVDGIDMHWRGDVEQTTVVGFRGKFAW